MEIAGNKPRKIPIINKKRPKIKEDKYPKCIPLLSSAHIKIPLSPLSKVKSCIYIYIYVCVYIEFGRISLS